MVGTRTHRRVSRSGKKRRIPLSHLRTSEAVRTVLDQPRRLGELLNLLDDGDRALRGRAAAAVARLAASHPGRLVRSVERLRDGLADDSAYVRWHLTYALGRMGARYPLRVPRYIGALVARLDDDNRVVRVFAAAALSVLALRRPQLVQKEFAATKREVPASVGRALRDATRKKSAS
jgi:HEAT repeat protein